MSSAINAIGGAVHDVSHGIEDVAGDVAHGAESLYNGAKNGVEDVLHGGAQTAATPQINSQPKPPVQPDTWTAPDVSGGGQVTVNHGALTEASSIIKKSLPELEKALQQVARHTSAFDSLMSWSTGKAFGGNMSAAVTAFSATGQQASEAHAQAATNLQSSAQSYSDAEDTNAKAAANISSGYSSGGSASGGSAPGGGSTGKWGK